MSFAGGQNQGEGNLYGEHRQSSIQTSFILHANKIIRVSAQGIAMGKHNKSKRVSSGGGQSRYTLSYLRYNIWLHRFENSKSLKLFLRNLKIELWDEFRMNDRNSFVWPRTKLILHFFTRGNTLSCMSLDFRVKVWECDIFHMYQKVALARLTRCCLPASTLQKLIKRASGPLSHIFNFYSIQYAICM